MDCPTPARRLVRRLLAVVLALGLSLLGMSTATFVAMHDGGGSSTSTPHEPAAFDRGMLDAVTTLRGPNRAHAVASASRALDADYECPLGIVPVSVTLPMPMPLAMSHPVNSVGAWLPPPPIASDRAPPRQPDLSS